MVAIAGIDTRKLTRILRTIGAQNGCIALRAITSRRPWVQHVVLPAWPYGSGAGGYLRQAL